LSLTARSQPKRRTIEAPDPGVLVPGEFGDVALGKVRRQIEVPRISLTAPRTALEGAEAIARDAGQLGRAERVAGVARGLAAADAELAMALHALDELETAESDHTSVTHAPATLEIPRLNDDRHHDARREESA
jgi:hypothetical protein